MSGEHDPTPMELDPNLPGGKTSATVSHRDVVDAWWEDKIRGSVVGKDVQVWNYMQEAVADLKKRLGG
jgi:hypothetical protein